MSTEDDIKLDKNARPFPTEEKALSAQRAADLSPDVWGVYTKDGGYAIIKHVAYIAMQAEARQSGEDGARARGFAGEKFFFIEFPGRGSTQDPENVELSWQGNRITVKREVVVPMAQRFLNVCDNAVQQLFEPGEVGGSAYVKAGKVSRRPYRIIKEATKADFDKAMAEGGAITKRSFVGTSNKQAAAAT